MKPALDFSWGRPDAADLSGHDVLVYTGAARPDKAYLDGLRATGIGICFIQESDPNRAQQGRNAGVEDAAYADGRADAVGYPVTASICYVVSDGSKSDPNYGANKIADYASGVAQTSRRPFFFYGNQYACDAAMAGAPNALGTWIPSTWGHGTLLTQEANIPSPVPNTDLNTVHAPYANWGGEEDDMTPEEHDCLFQGMYLLTEGATSTAGRVATIQAELDEVKKMVAALQPGGATGFTGTFVAKPS